MKCQKIVFLEEKKINIFAAPEKLPAQKLAHVTTNSQYTFDKRNNTTRQSKKLKYMAAIATAAPEIGSMYIPDTHTKKSYLYILHM